MLPSSFLYLLVLSQLLQNWICLLRIAVGKIKFSFDYYLANSILFSAGGILSEDQMEVGKNSTHKSSWLHSY